MLSGHGCMTITRADVKHAEERLKLVESTLRTELEGRGIKIGKHIGMLDGVDTNFRIGTMNAYSGPNRGRLTISMGGWGAKKSYAEPIKNGYDIPKLADRMIAALKEMKEDRIHLDKINASRKASIELQDVIRGEFPGLAYQFFGCGDASMVKLREQHLTIDQAREVAALLAKFRAEE